MFFTIVIFSCFSALSPLTLYYGSSWRSIQNLVVEKKELRRFPCFCSCHTIFLDLWIMADMVLANHHCVTGILTHKTLLYWYIDFSNFLIPLESFIVWIMVKSTIVSMDCYYDFNASLSIIASHFAEMMPFEMQCVILPSCVFFYFT